MRNVRNRGFKHCENTERSKVLVCVFREVGDFIEAWVVNERRAKSSRMQILFEPILIRSISFVFVSVRDSFSVRQVSASASEVASTSFLDARSTSVACFVSSRTLALLSQVARCFQIIGK